MTDWVDLSKALRSGVYVLRLRGRVVWVGRAKHLLAKLHGHAAQKRGPALAWLPAQPIEFDSCAARTCRVDQLDEVYQEVCREVGWAERSAEHTRNVSILQRRA